MIDKREKMSRRDRSEETRRTGNICRALSRGYRGDKTDLLAALMKITCEEQYLQFFFISSRDKKNCAILAIFSAFDTIFYEGIPVIALVTSQSTLKDELCDENSAHRHKLNKYKILKNFSSSSRAHLQYIVIAFITMRCTGGSMNINLRRSNDHKYKWQRSQIHSIRLPHLTFWGANFCQLKVLVMFCHVED